MARISRITQKIFAGSATNNGVFGSAQDGTKVLSNSLTTLMSKAAWLTGWLDAIMGASKFPPLEEFQAVDFVHSTQIAYLLQQGIAEYDAGTTYYVNNLCMQPLTYKLYGSVTNSNIGNPLTDAANWVQLADLSAISYFTTGDTKTTYKTTADTGWIMANDGSIGSASSGATTRANADTAALYTLFWTNISNTYAPVSGGRGGSAAADFAANKTLTLPAFLGRSLAGSGSGAGLTPRTLGQTFGEENHQLVTAELASHTHTATVTDTGHTHTIVTNAGASFANGAVSGNTGGTTGTYNSGSSPTGVTVANANTGSGTAHNTMQPTAFINMMIKL